MHERSCNSFFPIYAFCKILEKYIHLDLGKWEGGVFHLYVSY